MSEKIADRRGMTPQPQQFNAENFAAILAGQLQPGVVESLITSDATTQKTEKLIDFMEYEGRGAWQKETHLELLCEKLEAVAAGEIKRLMIYMPPRHGKSMVCSKKFPAWYLRKYPDKYIMITSYSADLAFDFSRIARNTIQDEREIFPGINVNQQARAVKHWTIENHLGGLIAAGVGGPITGRGAMCFVAGTKIATNQGDIDIKALQFASSSVKILTYGKNNNLEYKNMQAFSRRQANGIYRITTAKGRVVEVTGDHPFYVDGKYTEAAKLTSGDPFLCVVQKEICCSGVCYDKAYQAWARGQLLFKRMFGKTSCDKESAQMHSLWRLCRKETKILQKLSASQKNNSNISSQKHNLSGMLQRVLSKISLREISSLLFETVCKPWTLSENDRREQLQLSKWGYCTEGEAVYCQSVSQNTDFNTAERWKCLCSVFKLSDKVGNPSHRSVSDKQRPNKLSNALCKVSSLLSFFKGWEICSDSVALVERIPQEAIVYDIQVESNHNFFANGVLAHNCAIIDDPFKNYEEAASDTVRESVWQWYRSTLRTRLDPDGAIVLIQTRWHQDDLAGRLLQEQKEGTGEQWEVISLPGIAEENDQLGRKPGEALSPRFPIEGLKTIKKAMGSYLFSSLYQQNPRAKEGNYFKDHWFIDAGETQTLLSHWREQGYVQIFAAMDLAIGERQQNDFNVITVAAENTKGEKIMIDRIRFKDDADGIADEIVKVQEKWLPAVFGFEDGQIRKAIWPTVIRKMKEKKVAINSIFLTPIGDKIARARTAQGQMRQGYWLFPFGSEWIEDFKEEVLGFPNATHDDDVDSFAYLSILIEQGSFLGECEFQDYPK